MASILDRYGIKEVADVTFYDINDDGTVGKPVLYLDTLKVSTIEQTAEQVDARGGKGNPKLITWDYGKEITVTLEDAVFSAKSLSVMLSTGAVEPAADTTVQKTAVIRMASTTVANNKVIPATDYVVADIYDSNVGSKRAKVYCGASDSAPAGEVLYAGQFNPVALYAENGDVINSAFNTAALKSAFATGLASDYLGQKVFMTYTQPVVARIITVSGDTFPGTYYVQGDTYARSDVSGKDQFFQFIIPKAKMTAEQTITLEAEGDPSTFNMNLTVLRPEDGEMMKLVQYDLSAS